MLKALHAQGLANEDHTTLLLNCYTKLKDKSVTSLFYILLIIIVALFSHCNPRNKLDEFIFKEGDEVDFDVDIAIKVCR